MAALTDMSRHLLHLVAVGPLFLYVGFQRENVPEAVFNGLGVLGLIVLFYHSYKAYLKLKDGKSAWVNWIHILLVAPLLLIIAYLKKDTDRRYFEMMLLLGFAAIGYHGLYLIRESIFS
jgi:uncharacterized membrane protein